MVLATDSRRPDFRVTSWPYRRAGLPEARMVQHVGCVSAELEVYLSPDDEVLPQREVDVGEARTIQGVSALVAIGAGCRNSECRQVIPVVDVAAAGNVPRISNPVRILRVTAGLVVQGIVVAL